MFHLGFTFFYGCFLWAALLAAAAKKQAVALFIQALKKPAAACCKFLILPGYDLLYYWS